MKRRTFLGAAAAAAPALKAAAIDVKNIKSRSVKVDITYKSPHTAPNGLQTTKEGLWICDARSANGSSFVTLVNPADGKVIRDLSVPGLNDASGMTVDANNDLWVNSTHAALIFKINAQDGKVIAKYGSPGAGAGYRMKGDPPAARSPLTPAYPQEQPAAGAGAGRGGRGRGQGLEPGQVPMTATFGPTGEGGQGMEYRDGLLYIATLPTRKLYVLDPKTWIVEATWPLAGNRAHGVGWQDDTLWVADTNWRAFFRHDRKTGEIVEKIQLTEKDPLIHGVTVRDGYMWYTDDVGYICNFKL